MRLLGSSPCVLVLVAGCFIALPACGGGGGSGAAAMPSAVHSPAPVTTPTAGPAGFAPVSFSIALPKTGSATGRKPLYVPASTTSISISVNGTTPQVFPCTYSGCSGSFLAPAGGSVNFVFAALDGASAPLANTPTFSQNISANGANILSVTLNGVIARSTLNFNPPGLSSGASGAATVTATAYDADSDVITGTYSAPLVLGIVNDTTGTVTVTAGTLANDTAAGTIAYTYSPATAYVDNHFLVGAFSATETTPQQARPFEVGRTFYTFTSNSIVGFAPGATSPTRTITISPPLADVRSMTCDGSNVYVADYGGSGVVYGITPAATTPSVRYTVNLLQPIWVAAYGGGAVPGNRGTLYVANYGAYPWAITEFQGAISSPPFTIPANGGSLGNGGASHTAIEVDASGNVYAGFDGVSVVASYEVRDPTLATVIATGQNTAATGGASQIAFDPTVSPPRIYVQEKTGGGVPEISEYDNYATTPSYVAQDNDADGLFVDPSGNVYTSTTPGTFHVYPPGSLHFGVSNVSYSLPGQSLAFDSQGYVYAVNAAGAISVYQPGQTNAFATFPGTTYGKPTSGPDEFGTFCQ